MTNIIIRSDETNAAATALVLAAADNAVVLLGETLKPGQHTFRYLGGERTARLIALDELDQTARTVGIVFAEGESVPAGINDVVYSTSPDLFVIIGGGITAVAEAIDAAHANNLDPSRILHVGGFFVNGTAADVKAEKRNVMAGFLGQGTPDTIVKLAQESLPQISIGEGPAVALSSVNAFVHLPPMILNAMNVERGENLRFYVEGFGDSVCRLLEALDQDRLRLGDALGYSLVPIPELMDRSRGPEGMPGSTLREKINSYPPYRTIKLPSSLHHRYLAHELRSTFAPMYQMARAVDLEVPTIESVLRIGEILLDDQIVPGASEAARKFLDLTQAKAGAA